MKKILTLTIFTLIVGLMPLVSQATEDAAINLDKTTIKNGYNIIFDEDNLKLTIWPNALSSASKFRLKKDAYQVKENKGFRQLSDLYKIRCRQDECGSLKKDLTVTIKYQNPGFNNKWLMYYNPKSDSWVKLDTNVNEGGLVAEANISRKNIRQIAVFEKLHTAKRHKVPRSTDTNKKIKHGKQFYLKIKPETFSREVKLRVRQVNQNNYPQLPDEDILSNLFHYKVIDDKKPKKNITFKIRSRKYTENPVKIKKYTKNKGWQDLDTNYNSDKMLAYTKHSGKKGIFGLFESREFQTGGASWYNWHGAASNEYPMGTELKVTNLANGESCYTTVVSTGPFTPGLIIDLPLDKFGEIANPDTGIIQVRVEKK